MNDAQKKLFELLSEEYVEGVCDCPFCNPLVSKANKPDHCLSKEQVVKE